MRFVARHLMRLLGRLIPPRSIVVAVTPAWTPGLLAAAVLTPDDPDLWCPHRDSDGFPCELATGHTGRHYVID